MIVIEFLAISSAEASGSRFVLKLPKIHVETNE
jgi:hypothetical protein